MGQKGEKKPSSSNVDGPFCAALLLPALRPRTRRTKTGAQPGRGAQVGADILPHRVDDDRAVLLHVSQALVAELVESGADARRRRHGLPLLFGVGDGVVELGEDTGADAAEIGIVGELVDDRGRGRGKREDGGVKKVVFFLVSDLDLLFFDFLLAARRRVRGRARPGDDAQRVAVKVGHDGEELGGIVVDGRDAELGGVGRERGADLFFFSTFFFSSR